MIESNTHTARTSGSHAESTSPLGGGASSPSVTIILPTHTERRFIRDCLGSIQRQDYPNLVEVLVVDGGSIDGTRPIVGSMGRPFRLVDNPGATAANAMNIGLAEAQGDIIVRMDAHAVYARDYVRRCVEVLIETGAQNVGGRMRPIGRSAFGRAVAAVTSTPLAMGPGRFHYSQERSEVDTVFLGCWRRSTLERLGGFDTTNLQWAAEDHELNLRLRQMGGVVVLDPSIQSTYFPRESLSGLAKQYHNYGIAKVSTLKKHGQLPSFRSLPPAALVAAAIGGVVLGRGPVRLIVPIGHAFASLAIARRTAKETDADTARCFVAIEAMHWCFGAGFWRGIGRVLLGRPFVTNPSGHR